MQIILSHVSNDTKDITPLIQKRFQHFMKKFKMEASRIFPLLGSVSLPMNMTNLVIGMIMFFGKI